MIGGLLFTSVASANFGVNIKVSRSNNAPESLHQQDQAGISNGRRGQPAN